MPAVLITAAVGALLIILGISIYRGNINLLHSYHVHRVKQEDKPVFGRLMGKGLMTCGISVILSGILYIVAIYTQQHIYMILAPIITTIGFVIGIVIMIYATKKYNKGIF